MNADAAGAPVRLLSLGDAAWTVEFGATIAPAIHARVLGFCALLEALSSAGRLAGQSVIAAATNSRWHIPVCFGANCAPNLIWPMWLPPRE
ncbi:MAG: hypothetical protein RKP46_02205 [Candidatus Accumulibacter sp.]|uniref:hypothetical protein n=1 Tax=Accumulibacter sp. TaxID=2053492 RepID=UPI0028781F4B|nr:hypothetical protein [Accumulibacter sp.]MDS4013150.1 hypothetical protein [Accumulibacter sp.]